MSDLDQAFDQAVLDAKALPSRPDNDTLLRLYALYKQATEGDLRAARPAFFDFVGTAKHDAWQRLRGISRTEARQRYVDLVTRLHH